jgi:hypothetical protein
MLAGAVVACLKVVKFLPARVEQPDREGDDWCLRTALSPRALYVRLGVVAPAARRFLHLLGGTSEHLLQQAAPARPAVTPSYFAIFFISTA